jgi:DNA-binding NarL/FixJ family response regulator
MGYVHANSAPKLLREVKAVISHGCIWLGQQLLQRLIETSVKLTGSNPEYVDGLLKQLTKREQQVAQEAAKGLSNKEIARILNITERTVKAHLAATFERLHVKDRLQLALMLNRQQRAEPIPEAVVMPAPAPIIEKRKATPKKVVKPARRLATAKLA